MLANTNFAYSLNSVCIDGINFVNKTLIHARTKWAILWLWTIIHTETNARCYSCVFSSASERKQLSKFGWLCWLYGIAYTSAKKKIWMSEKVKETVRIGNFSSFPLILSKCVPNQINSATINFRCKYLSKNSTKYVMILIQLHNYYTPFSIRCCSWCASSAVKSPFFKTTTCGASSSRSDPLSL